MCLKGFERQDISKNTVIVKEYSVCTLVCTHFIQQERFLISICVVFNLKNIQTFLKQR